MNSTKAILKDAISIGGTELFKASFAIGNALPCATIMNNRINKCLNGNLLTHCEGIRHRFIRRIIPSGFNSSIFFN